MSAYLVTSSTIATIVGAWAADRQGASLIRPEHWRGTLRDSYRVGVPTLSPHVTADWQVMADELARENARSVTHRYGEDTAPISVGVPLRYVRSVTHRTIHGDADPANLPAVLAVLGAIRCYRYQSCEHPEWERSAACYYTEQIEAALIGSLARGYWEITADPDCDGPQNVRRIL